jgi:hypothetical protein
VADGRRGGAQQRIDGGGEVGGQRPEDMPVREVDCSWARTTRRSVDVSARNKADVITTRPEGAGVANASSRVLSITVTDPGDPRSP